MERYYFRYAGVQLRVVPEDAAREVFVPALDQRRKLFAGFAWRTVVHGHGVVPLILHPLDSQIFDQVSRSMADGEEKVLMVGL